MKKIFILITAVFLLIGVLFMTVQHNMSSATYSKDDEKYIKITQSSHYKEGRFYNAAKSDDESFGNFLGVLKEWIKDKGQKSPKQPLPYCKVDLNKINSASDSELLVTWMGHSTLLINIGGYKILTDPVFAEKVTFVGPKRFNKEMPVSIPELPDIDVVIVSHNHYDHLNVESIRALKDKTKQFLVPLGVGAELEKCGVERTKIIEMDWWDETKLFGDLTIAATPAQHFSSRSMFDRDKTLWASWVIHTPQHRVFFSGDSGYFDDFKKIGEIYGPFDMTFMECGAYNERWHHIHMFPEETLQAHLDVRGNVLLPVHWGAYKLALHDWYEPVNRLTTAAKVKDVIVATPLIGETITFPDIPTKFWWNEIL